MLTAAIFGLLSGSTLFLGALLGFSMQVPRYATAAIMAFGSGVLISTLTLQILG